MTWFAMHRLKNRARFLRVDRRTRARRTVRSRSTLAHFMRWRARVNVHVPLKNIIMRRRFRAALLRGGWTDGAA